MKKVQQLDPTSWDKIGSSTSEMTHTQTVNPHSKTITHSPIPYEPAELEPVVTNLKIEQTVNICMDIKKDSTYDPVQ